jgi:transposase
MTDNKWVLVAPSIPPTNPRSNKRTVDLRDVMNGPIY